MAARSPMFRMTSEISTTGVLSDATWNNPLMTPSISDYVCAECRTRKQLVNARRVRLTGLSV
jgi:hypothetical protein